ncbi:hypothetical protein [Chondromyces crocatus]|uniref:Uncharacterized protein n=1 Tax=Chondromyces crocatus TaxID=52 RepID=A0A0K1EAQ7_CHOCO|nr:hypothetical protein [Chondromyces crocatus]AKT37955.1 uncharacterized protein CMC5_020960 [Chondromyces crocatus]
MSITVSRFEISANSNRFYANGNQQSHVNVSVMKMEDRGTGVPVKVSLSDTERESITVVAFSSNLNQTTLPDGWSVDKTRNQYELGGVTSFAAEERTGGEVEAEARGAEARNDVPDVFSRFVRSHRTGTERLMARMRLDDGRVLTTNMSFEGHNFTSSVTLEAVRPPSVEISELVTTPIETLYDRTMSNLNPTWRQRVFAHRWAMPARVRVKQILVDPTNARHFYELGRQDNSNPSRRVLTRGRVFGPGRWPVRTNDAMSGGCVEPFDYTMTLAENQWGATRLVVNGCTWTSGDDWADPARITVTDVYGNTYRYRIQATNDLGDEIEIIPG